MIYKVNVVIPDEFYVDADTVEEALNRAVDIASYEYFTCESKVKYVSSEIVDSVPEGIKIFF